MSLARHALAFTFKRRTQQTPGVPRTPEEDPVANPAYNANEPSGMRSSNDRIPQNSTGVGESARLAVGDKVKHRLSGARGEIVDLHSDPFVKDVTHGIVNWVGDGDGFGQGYANTNLIKF